MIWVAQMQQFMGDHEIPEFWFSVSQVHCQRNYTSR